MITIEKWIRRKLAAAVAAGIGEWVESPVTDLGRPIYGVTDGGSRLVLYELGLVFSGPLSTSITCRYDEIQALETLSLVELMNVGGDLEKMVSIGVIWRGGRPAFSMRLPLRVYSQVVTVLGRIVDELAATQQRP